ncbi:hypothetical protein TBR22_A19690 [Luteitalea sp. TBR-22]|uniref:hypothetical protein n=1 Tax=Luteitalea sp. TBR-22 TaxID=2802971 RepID=UPI001AFB054B|nr:hypothetical protein [Luteitalea sp. TBR-22]BCS32747.1 hypothetical protein TBR22_A19690 [Luteitalea sp. TBR-22]
MMSTSLVWLTLCLAALQGVAPLRLDLRVFRGTVEVTRDTAVTVYPTGVRTGGVAAPLVPSGERRATLAAGQYDLQLLQQRDGAVSGIAWTTLRLLVDYPGEGGHHLEVINFDKTYGAVQVRHAGAGWSVRLLRRDGAEVARGVPGDGYQLLVAPAGTYDIAIVGPQPGRIHDVEVKPNLTAVRSF